ncbi:hypothetical protein, partial [Massilia sp. DD77]|uniref:hypothetical protein n=1 Tax=Massilia sp. DD77 TaxID=3109349 RepID=UPI002FFDE6F3
MTILITPLRKVMLVGPRLAGTTSGTPPQSAHAWAAELALAYRGGDKDGTVADSTQGIRVLLQSPVPDRGPGAGQDGAGRHNVPYLSPQLLGLLAGPHADFDRELHFALAPGVPAVRSSYELRPDTSEQPPHNGIAPLIVRPAVAWPMPQDSVQIEVPWLQLVQGSLPVLVDAAAQSGSTPFGFLGLGPDADARVVRAFAAKGGGQASELLPHLRLEVQPSKNKKQRLVRLELVPEGIAFEASIANPHASLAGAASRIRVRLCLEHGFDPASASPSAGQWSLKLVAPTDAAPADAQAYALAYAEVNRMIRRMRSVLALSQRTLAVDLDDTRAVPPVRWPLQVVKADGRLALPPGAQGDPLAWHLLLDAGAGSVSIAGDKARGVSLDSTVRFGPDLVSLRGDGSGIQIDIHTDRRTAAAGIGAPDAIPGPRLHIDIPAHPALPALTLAGAPAKDAPLRWFFDEHALALECARRYAKAQVLPAGLPYTWTFLPVRGGWLQWPLPLPRELSTPRTPPPGAEAPSARLGGELEFTTPRGRQSAQPLDERPARRQLMLLGADFIVARARVDKQAGTPVLRAASLDFYGADGKANGILWHATASPTPEQILPSLAAGPVALATPWFEFGRATAARAAMRTLDSGDYRPAGADTPFRLELGQPTGGGAVPAIAWQGIRGIPTVTAMPMTRTAPGVGMPSSTRHLLPGVIGDATTVSLSFGAASWCPALGVRRADGAHESGDGSALPLPLLEAALWSGPGAGSASWPGMPLVAVTLPGIEMNPALRPFHELDTRLRYDLPALDELFASSRLPESRPDAKGALVPPPEPVATSLDLDALRLAWRRARDVLLLSRTQDAVAGAAWLRQAAATLELRELFAGASWRAHFALNTGEHAGAGALGLGSYELGPDDPQARSRLAGDQALAGLSASFTVNGATLEPTDAALLPAAGAGA